MNERMVDMFYILMRDDVVPGRMEERVQSIEAAEATNPVSRGDGMGNIPSDFSNKGLEAYARELVQRIDEISGLSDKAKIEI